MRKTDALRAVLAAFIDGGGGPCYGYDIIKRSGYGPGTVYVILARLEREEWVTRATEEPLPVGRPPRANYTFTPQGAAHATALLKLYASPRR